MPGADIVNNGVPFKDVLAADTLHSKSIVELRTLVVAQKETILRQVGRCIASNYAPWHTVQN